MKEFQSKVYSRRETHKPNKITILLWKPLYLYLGEGPESREKGKKINAYRAALKH